ncbi:MAG: LysM peptidoglycan-binding domain-containing protein [Planctomycetia bacterium]|nr:LysM peptidoglycan-binding domain-containing protein [Planctomycetia bacterium]
MNTLKSMLVVGALAVVGYGVYVVLNNNPTPAPMPDEVKSATLPQNAPPTVQFGGPGDSLGTPVPANQVAFPSTGSSSANGASNGSANNPLAGIGGPPPGVMAPAAPLPPNGGSNPYPQTTPPAAAPLGAGAGMTNPPAGGGSLYGAPAADTRYAPASRYGATPAADVSRGAASNNSAGRSSLYGAPGTPDNSASAANNGRGLRAAAGRVGDAMRNAAAAEITAAVDPSFDVALTTARNLLDRGQLDAALVGLSAMYDDPRMSDRQREQLNDLLDQVSGTVIYSRRWRAAEDTYRVVGNERLQDIATQCNVPVGLLAKINGLNPDRPELRPGQELKIIRGPFQAVINVPKRTLTLVVNNRYAGRFPVALGPEFTQLEGRYTIADKQAAHVKYQGQRYLGLTAADGAGAAAPPLAIVGMTDPGTAESGQAKGLIVVTPQNAEDLYDILSQGSSVTIRR